jgi:hypothetical protein
MVDTNHHHGAPAHAHGGPSIPVEGDGVSYRGIIWFVVVLTVTTVICQVLMWGLLKVFQHRATDVAASPLAAPAGERPVEGRLSPAVNAIGVTAGPQPQLLVNEPANLDAFRTKEQETLTTYGWADQNAGVVRIPIDRAKELLIQRGLPARAKDPGTDVKK